MLTYDNNVMRYGDKISLLSYIFLSVNLLFFCYILVFHTGFFYEILKEDSYIEYLGFFFLLLTGIFLLYSGYIYYKKTQSTKFLGVILLIAGILFFWAAGEEISWGQRIFSIETPEALLKMNYQREMNIHNINKRLFQRGFRHLTTILVFISAIAFFQKKDRIFGIKLPDTFLVYAFLLMPTYASYKQVIPEYHLGYITIVFYLIYYIKKADKKMLTVTISVIFVIIFVIMVNYNFNHLFQSNNTAEVREYLFSFACLTYSLLLFKDARHISLK